MTRRRKSTALYRYKTDPRADQFSSVYQVFARNITYDALIDCSRLIDWQPCIPNTDLGLCFHLSEILVTWCDIGEQKKKTYAIGRRARSIQYRCNFFLNLSLIVRWLKSNKKTDAVGFAFRVNKMILQRLHPPPSFRPFHLGYRSPVPPSSSIPVLPTLLSRRSDYAHSYLASRFKIQDDFIVSSEKWNVWQIVHASQ